MKIWPSQCVKTIVPQKNLNRVAVILLEKADWTLKEGKSSHVDKARVIHLSAGVQGFDQG